MATGRCEYYHQKHPPLTIIWGFILILFLSTDRYINSHYVLVLYVLGIVYQVHVLHILIGWKWTENLEGRSFQPIPASGWGLTRSPLTHVCITSLTSVTFTNLYLTYRAWPRGRILAPKAFPMAFPIRCGAIRVSTSLCTTSTTLCFGTVLSFDSLNLDLRNSWKGSERK